MISSKIKLIAIVLGMQFVSNVSVSQSIMSKKIKTEISVKESTVAADWSFNNEESKYEGLLIQLVKFDPKSTSISGLSSKSIKYVQLQNLIHSGKYTFEVNKSDKGIYFLRVFGVKENGEFELVHNEILEI